MAAARRVHDALGRPHLAGRNPCCPRVREHGGPVDVHRDCNSAEDQLDVGVYQQAMGGAVPPVYGHLWRYDRAKAVAYVALINGCTRIWQLGYLAPSKDNRTAQRRPRVGGERHVIPHG